MHMLQTVMTSEPLNIAYLSIVTSARAINLCEAFVRGFMQDTCAQEIQAFTSSGDSSSSVWNACLHDSPTLLLFSDLKIPV